MKLILDEMHAPVVAEALRARGFEAIAVAATPRLRGIADADLLDLAASEGHALVTENIADFVLLDAWWSSEGRTHAGLVFTHPKRFDRASMAYPGVLIEALVTLTQTHHGDLTGRVVWLQR